MNNNFKVGMTFEHGMYEVVKVTKCYVTINDYYHARTKEIRETKRCKIRNWWGDECCFFNSTTLEVKYNDENMENLRAE